MQGNFEFRQIWNFIPVVKVRLGKNACWLNITWNSLKINIKQHTYYLNLISC